MHSMESPVLFMLSRIGSVLRYTIDYGSYADFPVNDHGSTRLVKNFIWRESHCSSAGMLKAWCCHRIHHANYQESFYSTAYLDFVPKGAMKSRMLQGWKRPMVLKKVRVSPVLWKQVFRVIMTLDLLDLEYQCSDLLLHVTGVINYCTQ